MRPIGSHSTSGREKEGNKERTEVGSCTVSKSAIDVGITASYGMEWLHNRPELLLISLYLIALWNPPSGCSMCLMGNHIFRDRVCAFPIWEEFFCSWQWEAFTSIFLLKTKRTINVSGWAGNQQTRVFHFTIGQSKGQNSRPLDHQSQKTLGGSLKVCEHVLKRRRRGK